MNVRSIRHPAVLVLSAVLIAPTARAQESSIYVQCPSSTDLHPTGDGIQSS